MLAMNSLKKALRASRCAIVGYGRIGRALGDMLRELKADTTVFARRNETRVLANENGLKTQNADFGDISISESLKSFDVIFNTVPERIISNELLLSLPSKTVLVELASSPGGFDTDIAIQSEVNVVDGRGLPGKYAPETAGRIVAETVLQYLKQEDIL